jgi:mRNA interferase RelE/StbE
VSRFTVYITPEAYSEVKELPGHIRQRIREAIDSLAEEPRPPRSKALHFDSPVPELRRLRLDHWRIVYTITEADHFVDVLGVRRRPPYDYGDLEALLKQGK